MSIENSIREELTKLEATLAAHPERRLDLAQQAVERNEPRQHPVLYIGRQWDTEAGEGIQGEAPPHRSPEERLFDAIRGMTGMLGMLNPISPYRGLGKGTGTLAASFGIFLDPKLGFTPSGSRPLDEVLVEGMPDPDTSGVMPEILEDIETTLRLTPDWIRINPPDMQGPFNIAHMILGNEAFTSPIEEPDKFSKLMTIVTDFYIAVDRNIRRRTGKRFRQFPYDVPRIAECSTNMVSTEFYMEHVLPHDRRIGKVCGKVMIHPCSGPHVFYETTRNLPVVYNEAGNIEKACAGSISVDAALAEIGNHPIILHIGQELPAGHEEEFIKRDLDRARSNNRLVFGYTGMHWKKKDEPLIRDLHQRLDDYWSSNVL
jgi:hypothetical protein